VEEPRIIRDGDEGYIVFHKEKEYYFTHSNKAQRFAKEIVMNR